jgi:broad specificity phosphatase PhoE
MSDIYFIRHGQASFGSSDYDQLSPIGIRQSQILADHLAVLDIGFDAVYSGRMKRQQDTAQPLCRHYARLHPDCAEPTILPAFDEYDARALLVASIRIPRASGARTADDLADLRRDKQAFQAYFAQTLAGWLKGDFDGQPGVEAWSAFSSRVRAGVAHLIQRHGNGSRIAVFTSGGPIAVVIQMALDISNEKTVETSWQIMNASMTSFKYNPSGLALSGFNNTTALLLAKDPTLLTYR